jgi:hypothetical protein
VCHRVPHPPSSRAKRGDPVFAGEGLAAAPQTPPKNHKTNMKNGVKGKSNNYSENVYLVLTNLPFI